MRLVFLGTPEFATPALRRLHALDAVRLVVSQPDRPAGRKGSDRTPAVVDLARALGVEAIQPSNLNSAESIDRIKAAQPDVLVVVAYGRLLREPLLALAPAGVVNLHPSLLPAYRGASPIQAAIYDGQPRTGLTLMQMDAGLDTGPLIANRVLDVGLDDTSPVVHEQLAEMGAELIEHSLAEWVAGRMGSTPQDETAATVTRPLERTDAELDLHRPARALYDQWRAFQRWPGAFISVAGKRIVAVAMDRPSADGAAMGRVDLDGDVVTVGCAGGALRIRELQPEGRKAMSARAFANGYTELLRAPWGQPPPAHRPPLVHPAR